MGETQALILQSQCSAVLLTIIYLRESVVLQE